MNSGTYTICDAPGGVLERVRYYPRQLIDASTLTTDQDYVRYKARQHNRMLHGWGVVCGLEVRPNPTDQQPWRIKVCPGYALTPQGDGIDVRTALDFDLATGTQSSQDPCANALPCPPIGAVAAGTEERVLYFAARYTECLSRPERVSLSGCGCDESACEYARIRDGLELKVLFALPESHRRAAAADQAWCEQLERWAESKEPGPAPVPPCPECPDEPWVVLARIRVPPKAGGAIDASWIGYEGRRVVYSVAALRCFPSRS
jgi:hypothetical protein